MSLLLKTTKIINDWTDYNGHMNLSYYILVFDMGAEIILSKFKMGEHSAKTTKKSTMAVESHTTYNNEDKEGEEVDVFITNLITIKKDFITNWKCTKKVKIFCQQLLKFYLCILT